MDAKSAARERIEEHRDELIALSHRIHAHPELGYQEMQSSAWLEEALRDAGFEVEAGICDLPTAFRARSGSGPLHITICAEYDALPGIGHACGHNIIAASAVGAALGAARVAGELGLTVTVLGTPAEEVGNAAGKVLMLERGAFDGTHAAMMIHPAPYENITPRLIAGAQFVIRYTGKSAHAAAAPELGINAADALTVAQVAIGLLRQHIRGTDRIHGIVTDGGDAPNIVPAHAGARYIVRADTFAELSELIPRVFACFEAGALATGAKLEISGGDKPYAHVQHDPEMAALYRANAEVIGRVFDDNPSVASTDMGNVSLVIPTIHPMIGIDSLPAVNHQPEFTVACATPAADRAVLDGAVAMAWTAIDLAQHAAIRERLLAHAYSAVAVPAFES
ncbi:MAG: M20 family metallopeptidase [Ktedonobacterales bacterium]